MSISIPLRELGASHSWEILELLSTRSCTVGQIAATLELDLSDISRRLGRLREIGWVVVRARKKFRLYALSDAVLCQLNARGLTMQFELSPNICITVAASFINDAGLADDESTQSIKFGNIYSSEVVCC